MILKIEKSNLSIFLIWLVTVSGLIGISLGHLDWFIAKTPWNLLLGFFLLLWNFPPKRKWTSFKRFFAIFLMGIGVEWIGVNTGLLFGSYSYGENLGFKLYGVPPLIGINWLLLSYTTACISKRFVTYRGGAILLGALLMVGLDFLIEPLAPHFNFWTWEQGFPPIRNFIDWFLLSIIFQIIIKDEVPAGKNVFPIHHFLTQLIFFTYFFFYYAF